MELTVTQELAGFLLGEPLADWVAQRRAAGTSWERIGYQLREATNGRLTVTSVTLRRWYGDIPTAERASA